jgi:hypothetical protein
MDFRVLQMKYRRNQNGGAREADGYARSDRIAEPGAVREAASRRTRIPAY